MTAPVSPSAPVELLPCPNPWCAAGAMPLPCKGLSGWRLVCGCGVRTTAFTDEAEAIAEWNGRAASPAPSMVGLREKVARLIYDDLEGPVANQDFGRQQRQWEQCLHISDQCLALLAREGV